MRHRRNLLFDVCLGVLVTALFGVFALAQEDPPLPPPPPDVQNEPEPHPDDPFGPDFPPYDQAEHVKRQRAFQAFAQEFLKLMRKAQRDDATDWNDVAEAQLRIEQCALLLARYTPSAFRDERFDRVRESGEKTVAALLAGKEPPLAKTGLIERAYFSPIDRSAQPYFVYVPEKLDANRKPPLIIFLHGYVTELDKVNWYEMTVPTSVNDLADEVGAVVVTPFARSNTDFLGVGERDVLRTMQLVLEEYGADPDRVFLTGVSMGGSGVWAIAAHYPHLFAGAVPVAGRTDYNLWQNIDRGILAEFKQLIVDRDYAIAMQPNFRNLPVFAFHGEIDTLIRPAQTRTMVDKLKEQGFDVTFEEIKDGDHWSFGEAFKSEDLAKWMGKVKRKRTPKHISYRTWHPRFNRAHWVTIDDFTDYGRSASIDVEVKDRKRIVVKTQNVARFSFEWPETLVDRDAVVKTAEGRVLKWERDVDRRHVFTLDAVPKDGLRKTAGLSGPVWEACQGPFLMVFGSQGNAKKALYTKARAITAAREWFAFAAGVPRVKIDKDVTDKDIRDHHLVLFGTPETNSLVRRIADKLPITIGDRKYIIGGKTFEGKDLGLAMIYPNPLNPAKYVVVYTGTHWGLGLPSNHKLDFLPDYIVYEKKLGPVSGTNAFKVAGFFDMNWKLDGKLMWFGPEKAPPKPDWVDKDWNDPDWNDDEPTPPMPPPEEKKQGQDKPND